MPGEPTAWIAKRIASILARPQMWGSLEAVEGQVLTLLDLLVYIHNPELDDRYVLASYMGFCQKRHPSMLSTEPLHVFLADDESEFVKTLQSFWESLSEVWAPAEHA